MRPAVMLSSFRNALDRGMRDWHSLAAAIVALGLGSTILVPNSHADFSEEARVTAAVFADGDDDGRSVAISGDYAVVGAPQTDMLGE